MGTAGHAVPEFLAGHNVADWVDPEIEAKLARLEAEEEARQAQLEAELAEEEANPTVESLTDDQLDQLQRIRHRRKMLHMKSHANRSNTHKTKSNLIAARNPNAQDARAQQLLDHLKELGQEDPQVDMRRGRKRLRSPSRDVKVRRSTGDTDMMDSKSLKRSRSRAASVGGQSSQVREGEGYRDEPSKRRAMRLANRSQMRTTTKNHVGWREADSNKRQYEKMPKHLYSGKRGIGKTNYK